jgi:hypothetical protein
VHVVIIEPNPEGHRCQAVANVANVALADGDTVSWLTMKGAAATTEYQNYLAEVPVTVLEVFEAADPSTDQLARAIEDLIDSGPVDEMVVLEADTYLPRWWLVAPRRIRYRRPKLTFMYTRYPSRLMLTDRTSWKHFLSKAPLTFLALVTGALNRACYIAGRDDRRPSPLVHRAPDPAICTASAKDRKEIRERLGLPQDKILVGQMGGISVRKNVLMVAEAVLGLGEEYQLILAGKFAQDMRDWIATLPPEQLARFIIDDDFLSNETLDEYVAASDVATIAQVNYWTSGIMGKALVAGVPVVTAGSRARAYEARYFKFGVSTKRSSDAIARGIVELRDWRPAVDQPPYPTADDFGRAVLNR